MNLDLRSIESIEKLAKFALLMPFVAWGLLIFVVGIKKQLPPPIESKSLLHVDSWLTGSRHLGAGVKEALSRTEDKSQWLGTKSKLTFIPESGRLIFESKEFESPATLTYDGSKWSGFTTKSGRGMPVAVSAWADF